MMFASKAHLLIVLFGCILKLSEGAKEPNRKFEVEHHQLSADEKRRDVRRELISAVKKVDTETVLDMVMEGALDDFKNRIYQASEKKAFDVIKSKIQVVEALLKNGIAVVPSEELLAKKTPDERIFNVSLVEKTELVMRLMINISVVQSWTEESLVKSGKSPLFMICALPDVSNRTVKLIVDKGTVGMDYKAEGNLTALMISAARGNLEVVKYLVENGAKVNTTSFIELPSDGKFGLRYEFLKIFSRKNLTRPTTTIYSTALVAAVYEDHPEVVRYLLSKKADVNVKGQSWMTLSNPAFLGRTEIVKILLEHGIDTNSKDVMGATALHKTAEKGNIEIAKLLIGFKSDPNAVDNFGWTPLHTAAFLSRNKTKDMMKLLLDSGSDVKALTDGGFSVLNLAEAGNNVRFLGYLVGKFDVLNSTTEHKGLVETDSNENHADIITFLLEHGADLNHRDDIFGWSTLHWATASGDLRVTKLLLEKYGALMTSSRMGMTPFGLAQHFGRRNVFEYFNTGRNLV